VSATTIDAWLWATPNSNRVSILFEELGLAYRVHGVNIRAREQFAPEILALNPYGKIPIVVLQEHGGREVLFESGAILIRFAERAGRLLPLEDRARGEVLKWLMVVLTGLGPMMGQAHHWTELAPEKPEVAVRHSVGLVERLVRVLDARLADVPYLAGDDYSIADIAAFPWIARPSWASIDLARFARLKRWHDAIAARPAVIRGMALPAGTKLG
jgi:GST-like protein